MKIISLKHDMNFILRKYPIVFHKIGKKKLHESKFCYVQYGLLAVVSFS